MRTRRSAILTVCRGLTNCGLGFVVVVLIGLFVTSVHAYQRAAAEVSSAVRAEGEHVRSAMQDEGRASMPHSLSGFDKLWPGSVAPVRSAVDLSEQAMQFAAAEMNALVSGVVPGASAEKAGILVDFSARPAGGSAPLVVTFTDETQVPEENPEVQRTWTFDVGDRVI